MVLLWGSNARAAHPIFFHHLLKGVHNGARLFVVDPRRTESAQWADRWLGLDVGSDIALAHTMAREIIHAGRSSRTRRADSTSTPRTSSRSRSRKGSAAPAFPPR